MLSSELQQVSEYGGEMLYINKSARMPMWAMEYNRDEGARKFWDEFTPPFTRTARARCTRGGAPAVYNRNQDSARDRERLHAGTTTGASGPAPAPRVERRRQHRFLGQ
jgi:hypothetical protein